MAAGAGAGAAAHQWFGRGLMLLGELELGAWDLGTMVLPQANSHCRHPAPFQSLAALSYP